MALHRPRYADVAATAALVIALGTGGAYAAGALVGTSQIANGAVTAPKLATNAVTTTKVLNNAITSGKLASSVRNSIVPPWGTIPHHQTVTGRFFSHGATGATSGALINFVENINLPAKAPQPTSDTEMGFGPNPIGATRNSHCTGSFDHPTAPAGWVCVYPEYDGGLSDPAVSAWGDLAQRSYAFYVGFQEPTVNTSFDVYGTWAYTAP